MDIFTLFFQHLLHPYFNELGAVSTYDSKNKMSDYHHDVSAWGANIKQRRTEAWELNMGLKKHPSFFPPTALSTSGSCG